MPLSLREKLKHLAARLIRPGLAPVHSSLDRIEQSLEIVAGSTLSRDKHREELAYWRWLFKTPDGRASLGQPPEELFATWQRARLRELAAAAGLGGQTENGHLDGALRGASHDEVLDEALDAWCARQSAVEIGAGPYPALAAARQWRRAVAVDPLARGYAEENLLPPEADAIVYIEASGERVPLPSGSADLVIIENALDHVSDPEAVMAEIRRLLRDGGLVWLLVDLSNHKDHMHPHPFDEARVRRLLTEAGLESVSERVSDHKSHPKAYGEYRGLLRKIGLVQPKVASAPSSSRS